MCSYRQLKPVVVCATAWCLLGLAIASSFQCKQIFLTWVTFAVNHCIVLGMLTGSITVMLGSNQFALIRPLLL